MTDHNPTSSHASLRTLTSRRNLITSLGVGTMTVVLGGEVVGKAVSKNYHDDDDDHDDHHDGDVRPLGTVPPGSVEVRIDDDDVNGFEPGRVTIDLGESVTWVNIDDDPHTATGIGFDTGRINPGEQATITFDEPGYFHYSCSFHPIMTGIVEVRDESGQVPAQSIGSPEASPVASPHASPDASPQASPASSVSIAGLEFDPSELSVSVGTTVEWTNDESIPHTVTSIDDSFGSGTLNLGDTFTHRFTESGTFEYFCAIHPRMRGTVTVTD